MQRHLEQFLVPFKDLRRLELITMYCGEGQVTDGYQWERFILQHLPRLSKFDFNFSCWQTHDNILDHYRRPFWLDKRWYVVYDSNFSILFTVPHFAPSSVHHSCHPVSPDSTTLPMEKHFIFYDRVNKLRLDSDRNELPYRYNYVNELVLEGVFSHENVLDLSKVQSFNVYNSNWPFEKIITLIQESMPSVNYLSLNCEYPRINHQTISLKQIRTLCLPQYGKCEDRDQFNWPRLFPSVERLTVSINSKSQIEFLIYQFKGFLSGFFSIASFSMDKQIKITRPWLEKHLHRSRGNSIKNFSCRINQQFSLFSLALWISENDFDQPSPMDM